MRLRLEVFGKFNFKSSSLLWSNDDAIAVVRVEDSAFIGIDRFKNKNLHKVDNAVSGRQK